MQARLLLAWSASINLTAIRSPAGIAIEHIADSLAALAPLRARLGRPGALLDIGSGAGYPGLPLGLALCRDSVVLVESVGKKAAFLEAAAAAAQRSLETAGRAAPPIEVLAERAERLADDPGYRARFDVVTARGVARLDRLIPLASVFLGLQGIFVAWKRDDGEGSLDRELAAAGGALEAAGCRVLEIARAPVAGLEDHRLILIGNRSEAPADRRE